MVRGVEPRPPAAVAPESSAVQYVESLRRISQSLNSGMDLRSVLQAIVDALCDHTPWQLCWIYAMDTNGGFGEIAARRDRMEYTTKSPKERWPFGGNPAVDALTRNELIAIPDVSLAHEYPEFVASAVPRGVVASANIPLSSNDPDGRPMVLCVQSGFPLLEDPSQIPFLRAVASLASLAATNAGLLAEARNVAARASDTAALLSSTIDGISAGRSSRLLLREIEDRTSQSLIVFDSQGHLYLTGTAPSEARLTAEAWEAAVLEHRAKLYELARDASDSVEQGPASLTVAIGDGSNLRGLVTRFGGDARSMATVISFGASNENSTSTHVVAGTATAMVLLRDRLNFEAQTMLQRDVVAQLLEGTFGDRYEFTARATFAGIDVEERCFLVVARRANGVQAERAAHLGSAIAGQARKWPGSHYEFIAESYVLLLPASRASASDVEDFLSRLVKAVSGEDDAALVVTASEEPLLLDEYTTAWSRCRQTLDLAEKIERRGLVGLGDFGAYRVLLPALQGQDITDFIDATIGPLLRADRSNNSELFLTVETFANLSGKFQETARRLHIHVSTLRYRLHRATMLLGRDLNDEETRFEISLATRLERLCRQGQ